MLSESENKFISYWEVNREREGKWFRQLMEGIPIGLLFAVPIAVIQLTARFWYIRADAVANAKTTPWVLMVSVFMIAVFMAVFYKKYQWERKEQWYLELKNRSDDAGDDASLNRE
jgi:fatty acid desaturase